MGFLKRLKERYNDENILKTLEENNRKRMQNPHKILNIILQTAYFSFLGGLVTGATIIMVLLK
jgi:hypothetical protein